MKGDKCGGGLTARKLLRLLVVPSFLFLLLLTVQMVAQAAVTNPNLSISTQTTSGSQLTGYWIVVQNASGSVVQTDFSPHQFSVASGNYQVGVGDFGGEFFAYWTDCVLTRFHPVSISSTGSVSLTAVYSTTAGAPPPASCAASAISVTSSYSNGTILNGMYFTIQQKGVTIATGFTPATVPVTANQNFDVTVDDFTNAFFSHWSNGVSTRTITVNATTGITTLNAIYTQTAQPAPACSGSSANSIQVTSSLLNNTAITGMYIELRLSGNVLKGYTPVVFCNLQAGASYEVVAYSFAPNFFRHWADGTLIRLDFATPGTSPISLNAMFENIPANLAAQLNVVAQFSNGTVIGGFEESGMWIGLTPPGGSSVYTVAFSGSSSLPWTVFNGKTYTVQVDSFGHILFDHWQDNGSTNPIRSITMSGSITLVAIYRQG